MLVRADALAALYKILNPKSYLITSIHDTSQIGVHRSHILKFLVNVFSNYIYKLTDKRVCISNAISSHMQNICPDSSFDDIIYYGIKPIESNEKLSAKSYHSNKNLKIALIGRYDTNKNQKLLLEALIKLGEPYISQISVVMCGHNDYGLKDFLLDDYSSLTTRENIKILEFVDDIPSLLRESNYLISTSISEGLGLVAIESLMLGVPVIAPNSGAYIEYLKHNKNGFIYNSNDAQSLALLLKSLLIEKPSLSSEFISNDAYSSFPTNL